MVKKIETMRTCYSILQRMYKLALLIALICFSNVHSIFNNTRSLCYSGSVLYQTNTVDCTALDSTYGGDWYCSNIQVCEAGISPSRVCMSAKGCAKYEECVNPSGGILSNSPLLLNGVKAGGMKITVSCCKSVQITSDDSVAIDYNLICNDSSRSAGVSYAVGFLSLIISFIFLFHL